MNTNKSDQEGQGKSEENATGKGVLKIERLSDMGAVTKAAGDYLNDILAQYVDRPVLLLLAGGSSLAVLEYINPEYLSADLTVTVTDDRFSDELDINNFAILQSTNFYNSLIDVDAFCINTQPNPGETIEECATRFERNIKEWKADFPKGIIIALYGMGADGHTGGMIPGVLGKEEFDTKFNTKNILVESIDAEGKSEYPLRISTTLSFMRDMVDHAVFYITGENKRSAFEKAMSGEGEYSEIPARVMTEMKDAVVFTDIQ